MPWAVVDEVDRRVARPVAGMGGHVHGVAAFAQHRRMRLLGHVLYLVAQPVVAAGVAPAGVHPLLDDRPVALSRDEHDVVVELVAVLDGCIVHLRGQPADVAEPFDVLLAEVKGAAERADFCRCMPGAVALTARDPDGVMAGERFFQGAAGHRRRTGGMPVKAEDA